MDAALAASGRARGDATLVAVSKTVGVDEVVAAIDAGYRVFGENRPQELTRKLGGFPCGPMCPGALRYDREPQTKKINAVLGRVELVHSIGSLHLARALAARAERRLGQASSGAPQSILIEVNVSGEGDQGAVLPPASCAPPLGSCRVFVESAARGL